MSLENLTVLLMLPLSITDYFKRPVKKSANVNMQEPAVRVPLVEIEGESEHQCYFGSYLS